MATGTQRQKSMRKQPIQMVAALQTGREIVQEHPTDDIHFVELELDDIDAALLKHALGALENFEFEALNIYLQEVDSLNATLHAVLVNSADGHLNMPGLTMVDTVDHPFQQCRVL